MFGRTPLAFEPNKGQTEAHVKYLARAKGYQVFLTDDRALIAMRGAKSGLLQIKLANSNPAAWIEASVRLGSKTNYLRGMDRTKWITDVPNYGTVTYRGVYKGVDVAYRGNDRNLEYDYIVAPRADPNQIHIAYEGTSRFQLDSAGNLELETAAGRTLAHKPVVYQNIAGKRQAVEGEYVLMANHEVTFRLGTYDRSRKLIIDPILADLGMFGGSGQDDGFAVASEVSPISRAANGAAITNSYFITGRTHSVTDMLIWQNYVGQLCRNSAGTVISCPASTFQITENGNYDAFATKFNQLAAFAGPPANGAGVTLAYSTYIGGNGDDEARGIAVDGSGNVYIAGSSNSTNFPVPGGTPANPTSPQFYAGNGNPNAFLAKLNPDGNGLLAFTFYGGAALAAANSLALSSSNVIIGGITGGSLPNAGGYQKTFGAGNNSSIPLPAPSANTTDGFIALFDLNLNFQQATYLGGSQNDVVNGVAVDTSGNVYAVGNSTSGVPGSTATGGFSGFPLPGGKNSIATNNTPGSGVAGAFIVKLNPTLTAESNGTLYAGGAFGETANGVAVDAQGRAYVVGSTYSPNFNGAGTFGTSPFPIITGVNTTATAAAGATVLTVASGTSIAVGSTVAGVGIPPGTTVTAVAGTKITISALTTAPLAASPVTFSIVPSPVAVGIEIQNPLGATAPNTPTGQTQGYALAVNASGVSVDYVALQPATCTNGAGVAACNNAGVKAGLAANYPGSGFSGYSTGGSGWQGAPGPVIGGPAGPGFYGAWNSVAVDSDQQAYVFGQTGVAANGGIGTFPVTRLAVQSARLPANNAGPQVEPGQPAMAAPLDGGPAVAGALGSWANGVSVTNGNRTAFFGGVTTANSIAGFTGGSSTPVQAGYLPAIDDTNYTAGTGAPSSFVPPPAFPIGNAGGASGRTNDNGANSPACPPVGQNPSACNEDALFGTETFSDLVTGNSLLSITTTQGAAPSAGQANISFTSLPSQIPNTLALTFVASPIPTQAGNYPAGSTVAVGASASDLLASVAPVAGNGTWALNFNPTAYAQAGNYSFNLTVFPTGQTAGFEAGDAVTILVNVTVLPVSVGVNPTSVSLNAAVGTTAPVTAAVNVTSSGPFTATVQAGAPWLTVSPVSGTTSAALTISANPSNLAAATYTGTINIATPLSSTSVSVTFTVAPEISIPSLPSLSLNLTATHSGQSVSAVLTIVSASGSVPFAVAYSTRSGGNWLSGPSSGTATPAGTSLTVSANSGTLLVSGSPYVGTITISVTGTTGAQARIIRSRRTEQDGTGGGAITVNATLTLSGLQLGVVPPTIAISVPAGQMSSLQNVDLTPSGFTVTLTPATANGSPPFLLLSTTSLTLPATFGVGVDATMLSPGTYINNIFVQCDGSCFGSVVVTANVLSSQTIAFGPLSNVSFGAAPVTVTATASSGLPVSFSSSTPAVCAVSGSTVTIISAGTCTITASQAGSANYGAAAPVTQSFTVGGPTITASGTVPIYSSATTIQAGSWISIFGSNLASGVANWTGNFPTSLGGTSVTIDGKLGYLWYVSPTQINLQAPDDNVTGSVNVVVTTAIGSATSKVTLASISPSFSLLDGKHVAGIILRSNGTGADGGGTYDILGPTGMSLGYPTVAAKAGDSVVLFGVGFGPTIPAEPAGQAFSGAAATTNSVPITINETTVLPLFSGLSSAGLYQLNVTIPAGLGIGDQSLVATVGGLQTQTGVLISLQ